MLVVLLAVSYAVVLVVLGASVSAMWRFEEFSTKEKSKGTLLAVLVFAVSPVSIAVGTLYGLGWLVRQAFKREGKQL